LAAFTHPNIVKVLRTFEENDTSYIVLEYVEGSDLDDWLRVLGHPPSQEEIDRLTVPLLDALETIHTAEILHRDIQPRNIRIRSRDGTPVFLDFGLSRPMEAGQTSAVAVAHGYAPAELYLTGTQLQGPWTDIYSLSAVFYRALAGEPPPEAPERLLNGHVVPARSLPASSGYREIFLDGIDWGLEIDPASRPQNIGEWRKVLIDGEARFFKRVAKPSVFLRPGSQGEIRVAGPDAAMAEPEPADGTELPAFLGWGDQTESPGARPDSRKTVAPAHKKMGSATAVALLFFGAVTLVTLYAGENGILQLLGRDEESLRRRAEAEEMKQNADAELARKKKADQDRLPAEEVRRREEQEKARFAAEETQRKQEADQVRRLAEEARRKEEEEKARLAEAETRQKQEAERLARAAAEAEAVAEVARKKKADQERRAAGEARRKEEQEKVRLAAEEARRTQEEADRARRLAEEAKRKNEEEKARLAEAEIRRKQETDRLARAAAEAEAVAEAARKKQADQERRAAEEARRREEQERARWAAEETRRKNEAERLARAAADAEAAAEAARKKKADRERQAAGEARQKEEQEKVRLAADEARRKQEEADQARRLAEESKRKEEEEKARLAEAEIRQKREADRLAKAAAGEARRREEQERARLAADEARQKQEEADRVWKLAEEADTRRKQEADRLARAAAKAEAAAEAARKKEAERQSARIWRELVPGTNGAITAIALSDDGKQVAAGTQSGVLKVLRIDGFDKLQEMSSANIHPAARVSALALAPDGSGFLGAAGGQNDAIAVYDVRSAAGRLLKKTGGGGEGSKRRVRAWGAAAGGFVGLSIVEADGRRAVQVERWQFDGKQSASPTALETGERGIMAAAFSPKLDRLAVAPRQDDATSGKILIFKLGERIPTVTLERTGATPRSLAFSADGRTLAVAGQTGYIELWDAEGKHTKPEELRPAFASSQDTNYELTALAFSTDSRYLASADDEGRIYYWDLQSNPRVGRQVPGTPRQHIGWLAFLNNSDGDAVLLSPWNNGGVYRIALGGS
jgi:hypothetical protein